MARSGGAKVAQEKRSKIREEHWPGDGTWWDGANEKGWFTAPRSLPFVLLAMDSKTVEGASRLSPAYLDLFARHMGEGVVELEHEDDHAFAAGYGNVRTWRDRIARLEKAGFIKIASKGKRKSTVLLVHPTLAMKKLHDEGKIPKALWNAYRDFQIHAREPHAEDLKKEQGSANESDDDVPF